MKVVQPDGWPRPGGYANGVIADGRILAVAGQIGWNPQTRVIEAADFVGQTRQALLNVASVLRAAGGEPRDVVRLTWYITDRKAYLNAAAALAPVYREIFGGHYPAMSVVIVAGLIEPGALVEIEATAVWAGSKSDQIVL